VSLLRSNVSDVSEDGDGLRHLSTAEVFADTMLSEGVRARRRWFETGECPYPVPERASFVELRRAFLPSRSYEDVRRVGDKLLRTAELILANSKLYQWGVAPSCSALGLDREDSGESCWFDDDLRIMVCDCPDGYAEFLPRDYARAYGLVLMLLLMLFICLGLWLTGLLRVVLILLIV